MKSVIAVIDLGTTNIKATIMDETGAAVSVKALPTPVIYGKQTMEINPEELWKTVLLCCRGAVLRMKETVHVDAVVLSSMAASFVPMDGEDKVLFPAVGWSDSRSLPYMERYMERFLSGYRIENCGQYPLPMYAGFKLQWLKECFPEIFKKTKKWMNVSEFIYYRLLGGTAYVTDYSIASRTMLLDVEKRRWNPAALEYFSVDISLFPEPLPAGTVVGTASVETWDAGLSRDTKVVLGGHDHMCAVAGVGITRPGMILNSTGTSEAVVCLTESMHEPEKLASKWVNLECAVLPNQAAAVYYVGASGRVYQSALETLKDYEPSDNVMPESDLIFLPPQRAQLPSVKGALKGILPVFDAQQLHRAMRDGMYYECRRGVERILEKETNGDTVIRCVGGHTKNRFEMQRKSDATGCVIEIVRGEDIASKGAYILAGTGCGWYDSIPNASKDLYERAEKEQLIPDLERSKKYEEIYRKEYLPQFRDGVNTL